MRIKILIYIILLLFVPIIIKAIGFAVNELENSTNPEEIRLGATVLTVYQGGTGAQSFTSGECLVGAGTGAITTQACGGASVGQAWEQIWSGAITPTTTNAGIFVTASSTIQSSLRVDGNATTTGSFYVGSNNLAVLEGGKVGIGTTTPIEDLHIQDSQLGLVAADMSNSGGTGGRLVLEGADSYLEIFSDSSGSYGSGISLAEEQSTANKWGIIRETGTEASLIFTYGTSADLYGNTQTLVIQNDGDIFLDNGNIGIGATNPTSSMVILRADDPATLKILSASGQDVTLDLDSINDARINIDRAATVDDAVIRFFTNDVSEWEIGTGLSGDDENLTFYNQVLGNSVSLLLQASSGNIGIGETSPTSLLHLSTTTHDNAITLESSRGNWIIGSDYSNEGFFTISSSTALGTSDRLTIDNSGNVGIGVATPTSTLSVIGSTYLQGNATITATAFAFTNFISCTALETNAQGLLTCGSDDTGTGMSDINSSQLGQLSDVNTTTLTTNYIIMWDGAEWVSHATTTQLMQDELDTFSELNTLVADKTLCNEEDVCTLDANWVNTANPWADNEVSDTLTADWDLLNNKPATATILNLLDTDYRIAELHATTSEIDTLTVNTSITFPDPANCAAGSYPLGIDANGAVESCTDATTEIDSAIATHAGDNDAHHALVTLTGQDYLTLSTQEITVGEIEPDDLAASDFGDFSCNGTTCSIDINTAPFAWTDDNWGVTTSTVIGLNSGFLSNASSTVVGDFRMDGNATTTGSFDATQLLVNNTPISETYSPIAGSSSIVTVGTIGTGTWEGSVIATAYLHADVILSSEINTFSELNTIVADKTLVNEEDIVVWDSLNTFDAGYLSNASSTVIGDFRMDGNATTTGHFSITDGTNGIRIEAGATTTFQGF